VELIIKTAMLAVCVCVFSLLIGKVSPDMALLLGMVSCCVIILAFSESLWEIVEVLKSLLARTGLDGEILTIIFKAVAVSVTVKLASDICKDAKQNAIASTIELCGSGAVLCIAMPLLKAFVQMIDSLLT